MPARRPCARCGRNRSEHLFTSAKGRVCADCRRQRQRETARRRHVEQTYGLSAEDHDRLLEFQDGVCAICRGSRRYALNVDHDHATGRVRALICRRCNKLLRDVRDDQSLLQAAYHYLHRPPATRLGIVAVHRDHSA